MIKTLKDGTKLRISHNGNRYKLTGMDNEQLFNYMQACKTNVRQNHKRLDSLLKCVEQALFHMELGVDTSDFENRRFYKRTLTFTERNYSEFKL